VVIHPFDNVIAVTKHRETEFVLLERIFPSFIFEREPCWEILESKTKAMMSFKLFRESIGKAVQDDAEQKTNT